jgi:hypothetical protein
LLIVVSAPAIAVATGVFVTTVMARGGSTAPAALLPPLMPRSTNPKMADIKQND